MKVYDEFPDSFDYHMYLDRQDRKGRLLNTSVPDETKAHMLNTVLATEPADGIYMEVGPAISPYCIDSPRDFGRLYYMGIDGGRSRYSGGSGDDNFTGWGQKGGVFTQDMQRLAQTMGDAPRMSRASFLWADAQHLPFLDGEQNSTLPVRETFMRDVLMKAVVHPSSVENILREQARVLANDGTLIIRETDFTRYHHIIGDGRHPGFLSLIANLETTGFTKRAMLFDNDDAFPKLVRQFPGGDDNQGYNTGYFLLCQQGEALTLRQRISARLLGRSAICAWYLL